MQPVDGRPPASLLRDWRRWSASTGMPDAPSVAVAVVARALAARDGAPPELLDALVDVATASAAPEAPAGLVAATLAATVAGTGPGGRDGPGPGPLAVPTMLGAVYEATLLPDERRRGGVFYTPPDVAAGLVALALPEDEPVGAGTVVTDPAMGSGAFLVAAAERLRRRGLGAAACVGAVRGCDLDPAAVAVARTALTWWAWAAEGVVARPGPDALSQGDGLATAGTGGPPVGPATAVVGNPPFLGQLREATARPAALRSRLQERFGDAAKGYVDTALLFLLAATELVGPGGRVVLVQPESTLAGAHGAAARALLAERAELTGLWVGPAGLFDAAVRVWAPVLLRRVDRVDRVDRIDRAGGAERAGGADRAGGAVALFTGVEVHASGRFDVDSPHAVGLATGRWAPLLAASRGVPPVDLAGAGTLAGLVGATAGFRHQYYGLVPFVAEGPPVPDPAPPDGDLPSAPLVTSGVVAIGHSRWAQRPTRFAGRRWERPVVDLAALDLQDPALARWVRRRLRPKLVAATQTPVLVVAVDADGCWVPSVPVVSVEPHDDPGADPDALWLAAAVLTAPVVSAWAAARFAGAGLSASALRLSAAQLLDVPTPQDPAPWREAAALLRAALDPAAPTVPAGPAGLVARPPDALPWWRHSGRLMAEAYGVDAASAARVEQWWEQAAGRYLPAGLPRALRPAARLPD